MQLRKGHSRAIQQFRYRKRGRQAVSNGTRQGDGGLGLRRQATKEVRSNIFDKQGDVRKGQQADTSAVTLQSTGQ